MLLPLQLSLINAPGYTPVTLMLCCFQLFAQVFGKSHERKFADAVRYAMIIGTKRCNGTKIENMTRFRRYHSG